MGINKRESIIEWIDQWTNGSKVKKSTVQWIWTASHIQKFELNYNKFGLNYLFSYF